MVSSRRDPPVWGQWEPTSFPLGLVTPQGLGTPPSGDIPHLGTPPCLGTPQTGAPWSGAPQSWSPRLGPPRGSPGLGTPQIWGPPSLGMDLQTKDTIYFNAFSISRKITQKILDNKT